MNHTHDATHEEVLEGVLVGDLDELQPRARELLESCAECREALRAMRETTARLDAADREERDAIAEALATGPAPGEDRVADVIRAQAARRRTRRALIAVAAAALVTVLVLLLGPGRDSQGEIPLGTSLPIEVEAPLGVVPEVGTFRWRASASDQGIYQVLIRAPGGAVWGPYDTSRTEWVADREVAAGWPRQFEWQVRLVDTDGVLLRASAWHEVEVTR